MENNSKRNIPGWLALSPLFVFLGLYLASCIIAQDFYKIPISAAFLLASIYAVVICKGRSLEDRIAVFSEGAGNRNVLLMIWIFVLAGVSSISIVGYLYYPFVMGFCAILAILFRLPRKYS